MGEITKIYLVTNCYGDLNKIYIGKTINSRKNSHKKTFGDDIFYTYIDEVYSLDRKEWKFLESYWIEQFRQWGFEIMNKNKGGGGSEFLGEETKDKISKKLKNKPKPNRTKKHCKNLSKSLKGIPRKGSGRKKGFILSEGELKSRKRKRKPQSLETIEKRRQKNIGKKRTIETKIKMVNAKKNKPSNHYKSVFQYDLQNNLIKKWSRVTEASSSLKIRRQGIVTCALGKTKTYKNYIWKYY